MATTINPSDQTITQYNIQTGGASNLLNNVAPSSTSGVPVISQGASSQPVFGTALVAGGGTGLTTAAQGDLIYGSAANTYSALAKDTNSTRYLSNQGTSNNPSWNQVNLANGVTGQLPLANGGTNANLTASNGGIFYSTSSAGAILAGTATAGQILRSGASTTPAWSTATYPATAGTSGNVLTSDGMNWSSSAPTSVFTPNSTIQLFDDFIGVSTAAGALFSSITWSGASVSTNFAAGTPDSGHPGVVASASMTSGNKAILAGFNSITPTIVLGGGALTINFILKLGSLSNGTNRYTLYFGLGDTTSAGDQANGVYFAYSDNLNSGSWVGKTASSSSRSSANSSTAADTNYHNFQISINAAATSVSYFIDGVQIANSPLAANIPTTAISPFFNLVWSVGTVAAGALTFDLVYLSQTLTSTR